MTDSTEKNEIKITKEKSALYPYYDLKESLDFTKVVQRLAGKGMATEELLAAELGNSKTTKSFRYKISSARQFGFIVKTKEGIQITNRARQILNPVNESDIHELLKESFTLPPLYKKLIKTYDGEQLPKIDSIANLMYTQLNIARAVKDRAAKIFINSANFAKMIDESGKLSTTEDEYPDENRTEDKLDDFIEKPTSETDVSIDYQKVQMALAGGRNAKLIVPRDISIEDVERMKKLIDLLVVGD